MHAARLSAATAALALALASGMHGPARAQGSSSVGMTAWSEHCARCHGADPAAFAARALAARGEEIVGKKSGRTLDDFLCSHGSADPAEREELADMLEAYVRSGGTR